MSRRKRTVFTVAVVLLLAAVDWVSLWWLSAHDAPATAQASVTALPSGPASAASTGRPLRFEPFSPVEVDRFLAKAREAEKLTDPLQRCLAYPDPPRSHWRPEAVEAYCRYRSLPTLTFTRMRELIEQGKAAELDRRLGVALQAQLGDPQAQGALDRIYLHAFDNGSFDIRPTLDAWKRALPDSAFALAASGMAYAAMAQKARGGDYIRDTPVENIRAMDRLVDEADTDLRRAVQLEPRLSPAYAAMMDIGRLALGHRYALEARAAGVHAAPADYLVYGAAAIVAEPKWGGSPSELHALAGEVLAHARQNPLLYLTAADIHLDTFDFSSCNCTTPRQLAMVMDAVNDLPSFGMLSSAGDSAEMAGQHGLAAVYYSEAIRLASRPDDRLSRAFHLVTLGYPSWARAEIMAIAPALPGRASVYRGLGYADIQLEEDALAMTELEQAVRLDYTDTWSWDELGTLYANHRQWDKAWAAADQMIRQQPDDPEGWRLRAYVQAEQPRPGLADTVRSFADRFGDRPEQQASLRHMCEALARAGNGIR
ncbi:tetratricopeptide repeat protein [Frateuria sp. GZRe12]|uniref:tetratricopeptide repeat protein n=1 Tax=Frateuria sp. GZRe12 TaxID=3351533 RepID=UPI003EDB9F4C